MPLYDYRCNSCQTVSTIFTRSVSEAVEPVCARCGTPKLTRLMSPVAYHRSLSSIHQASGSPSEAGLDYYQDPRNIGRYVEDSFRQMGLEMPKAAKEAIEAAREGVMPKELQDS